MWVIAVMLVMKVIFKKKQMFIVIRFAQNIPELLEYGGHRGYLGYLGYLVKKYANVPIYKVIR